jgi:molybdopterin-containing oxidoreductase family membrane subunit
VFVSVWIEKGLAMIVAGFVPSPLGQLARYVPTPPELLITLGIYALGALIVTGLFRIVLSVRGEVA